MTAPSTDKPDKKKWAIFTNVGKEVTHFMQLVKKQNLGVAFKTKNSNGKVLNMNKAVFDNSGA